MSGKELTIGSTDNLKALVQSLQGRIAGILPKHLSAERFCKLLLTSAVKNPEILACTKTSLMSAMVLSAEVGLEINPSVGTAAIIPYKNNRTNTLEAQFQPMYRGLQMLATNHPDVLSLNAQLVYENDEFDWGLGDRPFVKHKPKLDGDRGEILCAYSIAWLKDSPVPSIEIMTAKELNRIKNLSQTGRRNSGPWQDHADEMKRKAVTKRHIKRLPCALDPILAKAISADNVASGFTDALDTDFEVVDTKPKQGAKALEDKIAPEEAKVAKAEEAPERPAPKKKRAVKKTAAPAGNGAEEFLTSAERAQKAESIKALEAELGIEGDALIESREKNLGAVDIDEAPSPKIRQYEAELIKALEASQTANA